MDAVYRQRGIRALLFDFDGTLAVPALDFALMRREAVAAIARHTPVPDRPDLPVMELLALIGEATPAARAARQAALDAVREVEIAAAHSSSLFPFVRPMLARLAALRLGMAIVTRNCPEAIAVVFPDARDYGPVLTRDDVPRVKPDPAHLAAALDRLGVLPEQALMVGDHSMDVEAGKRAGTLTAAVATGESSFAVLAATGPDFLAPDGDALMRQLGIFC